MNPDIIKEQLKNHLNQEVTIKVHRMRNKTNHYTGIINGIYPNIFTIKGLNFEKSFSYADVITGEIKIKYE